MCAVLTPEVVARLLINGLIAFVAALLGGSGNP